MDRSSPIENRVHSQGVKESVRTISETETVPESTRIPTLPIGPCQGICWFHGWKVFAPAIKDPFENTGFTMRMPFASLLLFATHKIHMGLALDSFSLTFRNG